MIKADIINRVAEDAHPDRDLGADARLGERGQEQAPRLGPPAGEVLSSVEVDRDAVHRRLPQ